MQKNWVIKNTLFPTNIKAREKDAENKVNYTLEN
jgi:hypothetical protein